MKRFIYPFFKKEVLFISWMTFTSYASYGQTYEQPTVNSLSVSPPSVNAGKDVMGSQSDINLFTGTANVNIPIYSYKKSGSNLPVIISLNYKGGGIQVEEMASNVGLGWGLNAGGIITRTQVGEPDDGFNKGYLNEPAIPLNPTWVDQGKIAYGIVDGEPDVFNYNFNGRTGAFILGKSGKILTIPDSKIKIERVVTDMRSNQPSIMTTISAFIITTEDGTKYFFDQKELSAEGKCHDGYKPWENHGYIIGSGGQVTPPSSQYYPTDTTYCDAISSYGISSWYLSKIVSPFGNDSITFSYEQYHYQYNVFFQDIQTTDYAVPDSVATTNKGFFDVYALRIKKITISPSHYISFYYDSLFDRVDLPGDRALKQISIVDGSNTINYQLGFKYIDGPNVFEDTANRSNFSIQDCCMSPKLILSSISKSAGSLNLNQSLYQFDYIIHSDSISSSYFNYLPGINSKAQDHWGFFNGKDNNSTLVPKNDSRDPVAYFSEIGSLKKITNMYDGYTQFIYEPNYIYSTVDYTTKLSGGMRVKEIINYDGIDHKNDIIKAYKYVDKYGTCSGFGGEYPSYYYTLTSWDICTSSYSHYLVTTSVSNLPLLSLGGSPVGYERVEETDTGYHTGYHGKTVYEFTSYNDIAPLENTIKAPFSTKQRKADWCYGLPKRVAIYDSTNNLLSEKLYNYNFIINQNSDSNFRALKSFDTLLMTDNYSPPDSILWFWNPPQFVFTNPNRCSSGYILNPPLSFLTDMYYPFTGRVELMNVIEKRYFDNSPIFESSSDYGYDPNYYNVESITTTNSEGGKYVKYIYYPYNYTVGGGIGKLRDSGIITVPVASETWLKTDNTDSTLMAGDITDYQVLGNGDVKPSKEYKLAVTQPLTQGQIGAFNPALVNRNPNYFSQLTSFDNYDTNGNLLQITSKASPTGSLIWDYDHQYAIAKVTNASSSDIAYTSFEADGSGNLSWLNTNAINSTDGITGNKCFDLSLAASTNQVYFGKNFLDPNKTYIVSVWSKNGAPCFTGDNNNTQIINGCAETVFKKGGTKSGWTYYEARVTNVTQVGMYGSGLVDEFRVYPSNAQMTTYTYQPPFGMTSSCSPNNTITYYEYDGLGRLHVVRDMDGNIIKTIDYNFKK